MATRRNSDKTDRSADTGENASASEHAQRVSEQAGMPQLVAAIGVRERVWELHVRGLPKYRIAATLGLDRGTVARYIQACYREIGSERRARLEQKLAAAVARMRRIQEQAWDDHDADDARERSVLGAILSGESAEQEEGKGRSMVRYQSQRSQYLRLALDAEKEIARLEGLYEASGDESGAVVFRIEKLAAGVVSVARDASGGMPGSGSVGEGGDDGSDSES